MYYKTTELPPIQAKSAYTEVFAADGYIYLHYPSGQNIPDGLTEITEEEWIANKPEVVVEEEEPTIEVTEEEKAAAILEGVQLV